MSTAPAVAKQPEPKTASAPGLFSSPGKRRFVLSLLLVACTLGIYNQATHFSFINFDDDRYVTDNAHVRAGPTWDTVRWALTSTDEANWHPLTWMSHALDVSLFRMNPAGHHLTSIALHAVNVVLLFLLLWRATRQLGPSFFVALVFAIHPINVESVAWIAERKNVLCTTFFLLTLGAYGWYASRKSVLRYLAVMALFFCGLASKPMVVTLPFVLLLLDYWPLGRIEGWSAPSEVIPVRQGSISTLILEKVPLFALSAISAVITMHAQRAAGAVETTHFSLAVRLKNAVFCYAMYLWKTVWPAKLAALYPHPGPSLAIWKSLVAGLFLLAVTAFVLKLRARRYLLVGWLWFLGTLVPVIGLVQVGNQAMADRYAYIPLMGIFVMIAWGAADFAAERKVAITWTRVAATCALLALSAATYRQIGYWRNSLTLWSHALAVTSNNFVAESSLGGALVALGRVDEAYPHFVRAAEIQPADPVAHLNIGAYQHEHGHIAEAVSEYQLALRLTNDARLCANAYANLGAAYRQMGDVAKAQASYEHALELNPNQFSAWLSLGGLARDQGNLNEALADFSRSLKAHPTAEAYFQIGRTLEQANRRAEALSAYEQAAQMAPEFTAAQEAADALKQRR